MIRTLISLLVGGVFGGVLVSFLPKGEVLPDGAIMAFEKACPDGWMEYQSAAGRVLVGAGQARGLVPRVAGETGGKDEILLSGQNIQIPGHVTSYTGRGVINSNRPDYGKSVWIADDNPMPPFLVVKLCLHSQGN